MKGIVCKILHWNVINDSNFVIFCWVVYRPQQVQQCSKQVLSRQERVREWGGNMVRYISPPAPITGQHYITGTPDTWHWRSLLQIAAAVRLINLDPLFNPKRWKGISELSSRSEWNPWRPRLFIPPEGLALHSTLYARAGRLWAAERHPSPYHCQQMSFNWVEKPLLQDWHDVCSMNQNDWPVFSGCFAFHFASH